MDTVYIKMCDCPEIQSKAPSPPFHQVTQDREFVYDDGDLWLVLYTQNTFAGNVEKVWLPTQSDLQKMLGGYIRGDENNLLYDFNEWYDPFSRFTSMEQLWLAFVMKEKHQKQWVGEKWELIDEKKPNKKTKR